MSPRFKQYTCINFWFLHMPHAHHHDFLIQMIRETLEIFDLCLQQTQLLMKSWLPCSRTPLWLELEFTGRRLKIYCWTNHSSCCWCKEMSVQEAIEVNIGRHIACPKNGCTSSFTTNSSHEQDLLEDAAINELASRGADNLTVTKTYANTASVFSIYRHCVNPAFVFRQINKACFHTVLPLLLLLPLHPTPDQESALPNAAPAPDLVVCPPNIKPRDVAKKRLENVKTAVFHGTSLPFMSPLQST